MAITTGILTGGVNNHQTTSEEANAPATDFFSQGVIGALTSTSGVAPTTGAFSVNAQASPDMTVAVGTGVAYVTATPSSQGSQTLRVKNSASSNVTISSNASGSTKYDWLYLSISAANAAAPNTAADNVATLVTSRSSSASTDDGTPPTYGLHIATITVANAASSITNSTIADTRTPASLITSGVTIQRVSSITTAVSTGSTLIPLDDTIPQSTEGDQYMTLAITPKSSSNTLVIEAVVVLSSSAAVNNLIASLFQDSTASALAAVTTTQPTANYMNTLTLRYVMTAGTAVSTTFKIRAGGNAAGTTTFNGLSSARIFGAITKSSLTITEYKA